MSEAVNPENEAGAEGRPKKRGKILILLLLVVILGGGGAGGYFFFLKGGDAAAEESDQAGAEETAEKPSKKKKKPKKKTADEDEESEDGAKSDNFDVGNDENVKKVIDLQPFIVNLADSEESRYLRLNVSVGVGGESEGDKEKPDQLFITRVRSAMLAVLSTKKSDEILTNEGKIKLRRELLKAAQAASEEPHVEAIYFTDFIVQM